ncbi:MAG: metalloregulator ArsR/SmtB family transcription factor [Myxococcota bacterium]
MSARGLEPAVPSRLQNAVGYLGFVSTYQDDETAECEHHASPNRSRAPDEVVERAAAIFRAAGDPGRLRILEQLSLGEQCVSELAAQSGEGMSTVSQRLRLLRSEKLVIRRREGKHIFYALADEHVDALVQSALNHAYHD